MRFGYRFCCSAAVVLLSAGVVYAQGAPETARAIAGGGISVPGWQGKIDAGAEKPGQTVNDDKFAPEGKGMRVTTGPAVTYWNPKNVAKGDYTVSATFMEPKYHEPERPSASLWDCDCRERSGDGGPELALLRGLWEWDVYRARVWPAPFQMNGRGARRTRRCIRRRAGRAGDAGYRDVGEGRQGDVLDEWDGGWDVR